MPDLVRTRPRRTRVADGRGDRLLDLELGGSDHLALEWQAGSGEAPSLYLDAQGPLTAAQAREVAAALLRGAELYGAGE